MGVSGNNFTSTIELTESGEYVEEVYKNGQFSNAESGTYEVKV